MMFQPQTVMKWGIALVIVFAMTCEKGWTQERPWKIDYEEFKSEYGNSEEDIVLIEYFEGRRVGGFLYLYLARQISRVSADLLGNNGQPPTEPRAISSALVQALGFGALAYGMIGTIKYSRKNLWLMVSDQKEIPPRLLEKAKAFYYDRGLMGQIIEEVK